MIMAPLPDRSQRSRRSGTGASRKKSSSLSLTSLFSSLTSGSSGSNTTITQESVSSRPASKRTISKASYKAPDGPVEVRSGSVRSMPVAAKKKSEHMAPVVEKVDVFAFMEQDEDALQEDDDATPRVKSPISQPASPTTTSTSNQPSVATTPGFGSIRSTPSAAEYPFPRKLRGSPDSFEQRRAPPSRVGSFTTDSGISIPSTRSNQSSPILQHKSPKKQQNGSMSMVREASRGSSKSRRSSKVSTKPKSPQPSTKHSFDSDPESFYGRIAINQTPFLEQPVALKHIQPPNIPSYLTTPQRQNSLPVSVIPSPSLSTTKPAAGHLTSPLSSSNGYNLLATNISSTGTAPLKPIYRRFESLHNRMLLYLQDQLSELEEDLKRIDHAIADLDHGKVKASRRAEVRRPSQLHWARMDVTGRIMSVLESYNRSLTTYSSLSASLSRTNTLDITAYRDWLSQHSDIVDEETFFLEHAGDLATITSNTKTTAANENNSSTNNNRNSIFGSIGANGGTGAAAAEKAIIQTGCAMLAAVLAFRAVPGFVSRVVIGGVIVGGLRVWIFGTGTGDGGESGESALGDGDAVVDRKEKEEVELLVGMQRGMRNTGVWYGLVGGVILLALLV